MKKLLLVLTLVLIGTGITLAQRNVQGTVSDDTGEPLIGANVVVKGTTTGASTDFDGKYSISVPDGYKTLVISYTGFETQEIELGASNVVDITLSEGLTLEAAVVTALGIQRDEKALGYAVQEVEGDDITQANTVSVLDALAGKAAGVQITSASGAAGAATRIVLRGQTSFNGNNEALIVVDGVRIDNSEQHSERSLQGVANSNRAMDINPNDIESVTVLKGAAATALYGVDGARGVVVITTKKGGQKKGGGISVNYGTTFTVAEVNKLPKLQDQYAQGISGVWQGPETGRSQSWGPALDTMAWDGSDYAYDKNGRLVSQNDPAAGTPVQAYDNLGDFFQRGTTWTNNLSFSGGNETTTYRVSFGHTDQEGIVPLNTYNRTNVGVSGQTKLFDNRFHIATSINYAKSGGRRVQQGSNISGLMLGLLRTPASFDNANGASDPVNDPDSYYLADGSQRNYRGGGGYDNPYWVINNSPFFDDVNRMYGNVRLSWDFNQWVTLSSTIGTDFYSDIRKQEFEIGSRSFPAGQVLDDEWFYRNIDAYVNLTGGGNLSEDFTFSYNVGVNHYTTFQKNLYTQGDGLGFPGFRELSNVASVLTVNEIEETKNFGLFGSIDLGYKNFLYLTLTGRQDWLSTLIAPSKEFSSSDVSVFYPSASLSFIFSELLEQNDLFSFGKLRLSFAQVGGGAPDPYLTSTNYIVPAQSLFVYSVDDGWTNGIAFPFNGSIPGFTYNPVLGNPNLIPSLTTDFEVGLDLRLLKNRVGIDLTYYTRKSEDQILTIPIANSTGFQRAVLNSGSLSTDGIELVLSATPVRTKDFSWDVALNFSTWETIVDELYPGVETQYLDGFTGTGVYNIPGQEFGQIFGGAFQRANTPDGMSFDQNLPYNPDGALIIGADGYPLADNLQRVIGNPNPDFLLGINNTLTYKNFSLSFLFDIKQGGDMWNGTQGALTFFGMSELTEDRDALGSDGTYVFEGIKEDGTPNDVQVPLDQSWYLGNGGGFGAVDEGFIQDASFYRLRLLSFSYTFGNNILEGTPLRDLKLTFTGRNLLLWTPYEGVDPETSLVGSSSNGQGLDYFQMPGTRSYALGLNVSF